MRIISEFETQFKLGQESLNKIKLDYKTRVSSFLTYAALKDILLLKIRANKK
jgi:hypothetical protein